MTITCLSPTAIRKSESVAMSTMWLSVAAVGIMARYHRSYDREDMVFDPNSTTCNLLAHNKNALDQAAAVFSDGKLPDAFPDPAPSPGGTHGCKASIREYIKVHSAM